MHKRLETVCRSAIFEQEACYFFFEIARETSVFMPGRQSAEREAFLTLVACLSRPFLAPVDTCNRRPSVPLCSTGDRSPGPPIAGLNVETATGVLAPTPN